MPGRLSLRTRLLLGVLVLAATVLIVADVTTSHELRSFLIQRTDSSLESAHTEVEAALRGGEGGPRGSGHDEGRAAPAVTEASPSPAVLAQLVRSLPGLFIETRSAAGKVLFTGQVPEFSRTGKTPPPPRLPATFRLHPAGHGQLDRVAYATAAAVSGGGRYRIRASLDPNSRALLIIATPLSSVDGTLHRLFVIELIVTAAGLGGILLLGLWTVRLALRPLDEIGKTAAAIGGGELSTRVARAEPRTEVGRLGLALNAMLGQIERAFQARASSEEALRRSEARMRRFVADASHELRNPIAAIRAYAELFGEAGQARPEDRERSIAGISREATRMSLLVEELLLLAHLDEGRPLEREPVQLDEVVFEAVETAHTLEPDRPIDLDVEQAVVEGDRARLRQVIDNLLSNVRAHTEPRTAVRVSVKRDDGTADLVVADSGPGMKREDAKRVFERFYRGDGSRAHGDGAGLGLSIVAAVAEAHGGSVSVRSTAGEGTAFIVTLPLAP